MTSEYSLRYDGPGVVDQPVGNESRSYGIGDSVGGNEKLRALKAFGRNTHSFLTLYPDVQHFRVPGIEGYIPLVFSKGLILICGEPVAECDSAKMLMIALKKYAAGHKCSLAAMPVGQAGKDMFELCGLKSIYIGKEPIFDLKNLPKVTKSIRQGAERAKRKGLKVVPYNESYRMQIELLCRRWQDTNELPPMQFLFQLRPLALKNFKKYYLVVDADNRLRAFLACSPIYARKGWYLEDLIRDENAPNGCTELLVTETLKALTAEGYDMATLALAPLAGLPDHDESHPIINRILRLCYKHLSFVYHFQTLEYFKTKFQPSSWEKNYFCYSTTEPLFVLIARVLRSFLPKSLIGIIRHKLLKNSQDELRL